MRTLGVVQGGGDHYPFVDPSDDLKGIVADISLGLNTEIKSVSVKNIVIDGDTVEICLVNEDDTVLFNSTDKNYDRKEDSVWGSYYRIVYWESNDIQLKLVLYQRDRVLELFPKNSVLDLRTIFVKPKHVSSLTIIDREGVRHKCSEKRIVFQGGYNTNLELTDTNTNTRRQNTLNIDVGSGYGAGRAPCKTLDVEDRVVRSINSVTGEDGALDLVPEDGYGFELDPLNAKIYVYNTDTPCCSCDEMDDLSAYVADVAKKYWEISEDVNDLRDQHEKNINNWVTKAPTNPKITREPFMLQAVGDGCQNVVVRADFTNVYSKPVSATIALTFNYFKLIRKSATTSVAKTDTIQYQEDGEQKSKVVTHWIMETTNTEVNADIEELSVYSGHLEPGKTMSVQLTGLYTGYRYNHVPTLIVRGSASTSRGHVKSVMQSVDCSCAYSAFTVSDITNSSSINALYNEVWEIKQR